MSSAADGSRIGVDHHWPRGRRFRASPLGGNRARRYPTHVRDGGIRSQLKPFDALVLNQRERGG